MCKNSLSPPWTGGPPEETKPDAALLHVAESTLDGRNTIIVRAGTHLSEEALHVVLLQPISGGLQSFSANGRGDALIRGSLRDRLDVAQRKRHATYRAIGVEVLMHFNSKVVLNGLSANQDTILIVMTNQRIIQGTRRECSGITGQDPGCMKGQEPSRTTLFGHLHQAPDQAVPSTKIN